MTIFLVSCLTISNQLIHFLSLPKIYRMNIRISIIFTLLVFVLSCKSDEPTNTSTPETKAKPTYNVVSGLDNEQPTNTAQPKPNNQPSVQTPPPSAPPQKEIKRDKSLELIDQVDVQNPAFKVRKNKEDFDQILTFLGSRTLNGETEDLKFKLFFWEDKIRGYLMKQCMGERIFRYLDIRMVIILH